MDIIMIRHGETEDNLKKIYSRATTTLTSKGIEQIKATKENLEGLEFSKVYYSPLTRTQETMKYLGLEGIQENRIREVDLGIFTGLTYEGISKKYPQELATWIEKSTAYLIPEGESMAMAYDRVKEFLEEIIEKDESVLLISHDGIIRLACCWVFDNMDYFFRFKADNGSINILSIVDDYKFISKLNDSPKLK